MVTPNDDQLYGNEDLHEIDHEQSWQLEICEQKKIVQLAIFINVDMHKYEILRTIKNVVSMTKGRDVHTFHGFLFHFRDTCPIELKLHSFNLE